MLGDGQRQAPEEVGWVATRAPGPPATHEGPTLPATRAVPSAQSIGLGGQDVSAMRNDTTSVSDLPSSPLLNEALFLETAFAAPPPPQGHLVVI